MDAKMQTARRLFFVCVKMRQDLKKLFTKHLFCCKISIKAQIPYDSAGLYISWRTHMCKKSIVFLRSNPVDPDSRVEKEVNSLLKAGHRITILAWDREKTYSPAANRIKLENGSADIVRIGIAAEFGGGIKKNAVPLLRFQCFLYKWLVNNSSEYDVIHACDFDTAFAGSRAAKRCKKKLVYDIFDYYVDSFNVPGIFRGVIEGMDHKIINSADAVIICNEQRREQIRGTAPHELTVIHNSPAKTDLHRVSVPDSSVKIAYVGILQETRFLKEIAETVSQRSDCELHIGGFGMLDEYFKEMSEHYENIIYYGRLKYSDTLKLEAECDIMTAVYDPRIRNHYYAASNKFYEALMLGKPIIMAKNTGMSDIVEKYDIGVCMEYTKEGFSGALDELIRRRNEWAGISERMKRLYESSYSWETMEKRLVCLYDKM